MNELIIKRTLHYIREQENAIQRRGLAGYFGTELHARDVAWLDVLRNRLPKDTAGKPVNPLKASKRSK